MQRALYRYLLLLQVLLGQYCYGQQYAKDTLFIKFRNDIQIEQREYRRVVWDDETQETYYMLISTHPIDVLLKYTDDSIPAVRAKIFAGLSLKNADQKLLRDILSKHLNDTAEFTLSPSDVVITWSVKEYMQSILNFRKENELEHIDLKARLDKIKRERYMIIPGAHHGIIIKDSLLKADSLFGPQEGMRVSSFVLSLGRKTLQSKNVLNRRAKRNISKLTSGDRILIENIKVEGPDKLLRQMVSIALKIM